MVLGRMNWITSERSANEHPICRIGGCPNPADQEDMCANHLAIVAARRVEAAVIRAKWGRKNGSQIP